MTGFLISSLSADLIRPGNGETINYTHVVFEWEQEPDAHSYSIQVSTTPSFDQVLFTDSSATPLILNKDQINWDGTYYWRIRSVFLDGGVGTWCDPDSFNTAPPKFQNANVTIIQNELIQDGLTLFGGAFPELKSGVIDIYGNEIWNDHDLGFMLTHVNLSGNVYGCSNTNAPNNNGMKISSDLEILWSAMDGNVDFHEYKQIPNGNYMGFLRVDTLGPIPSDNIMTEQFQDLGYLADDSTNEFTWYGQKLVEWDENHEIIWSWNPFDHFTMDDFDNHGFTWSSAYQNFEYDWTHANSFFFDSSEGAIYISFRHLSRITKISYPSGNVAWNMGLPEPYMATGADQICSELLFSFQHHIQRLDNGHLLFLDNGNISDQLFGYDDPLSRVLEVDVMGDSICEIIWGYTLPPNLFGTGSGSVQRLSNGNTLVYTAGNGLETAEATILEVTDEHSVVWKYISQENESWYRAYRMPSLHPDAFSVVVDQYENTELAGNPVNGIIIDRQNPAFLFTIHNESGYSQPYKYVLHDSLGWFNDTTDVVVIDPGNNFQFSIEFTVGNDSINFVSMDVLPLHHSYAQKSLNFLIYAPQDPLGSDPNLLLPNDFIFQKPFPNPFNPSTTFRFELAQSGFVRLAIYDLLGNRVRVLINETMHQGLHSIIWDGTTTRGDIQSAGVYLYRLMYGGKSESGKLLLLK